MCFFFCLYKYSKCKTEYSSSKVKMFYLFVKDRVNKNCNLLYRIFFETFQFHRTMNLIVNFELTF